VLVTIDIGNSSIGIGYFTPSGLVTQRLDTLPLRDAQAYAGFMAGLVNQNHIEKKDVRCIISSVVPGHTGKLREAVELFAGKAVEPLTVNHKVETGLCLKIRAPQTLGADRLTNASGAFALYHKAVAVVDFGTATTITMVDENANLIGGAILPGLRLMSAALGTMTSQLQEVPLEEPPDNALGRDTEAAIRSGLFYGTAGAVERIIAEIAAETGSHFIIVITGGHCMAMQQYMTGPCEIRPDLIHEGLRIIYEKIRP
jgi:type III pantothenate kinase